MANKITHFEIYGDEPSITAEFYSQIAYGGGTLGRSPFDMAIVLGQHVRVGNEDNLRGTDRKK